MRFKSMDVFPKLRDDVRVKTPSGAVVSLVGGIFIVFLLFSETQIYLTKETQDRLLVDTSRGEKLQINFNVTFPRVPCSLLSTDVMDVSGSHQLDVDHHLAKTRLDRLGGPISEGESSLLGGTLEVKAEAATTDDDKPVHPEEDPSYCGSCYGAEEVEGQCCNTCQEVKRLYQIKGWALSSASTFEQCERQISDKNRDLKNEEGCNVAGFLNVNRVAGNFHFAPGKSFQHAHMHVHDMQAFEAGLFDVSHVIHKLSFGEDFPNRVNPLDGVEKKVTEGGAIVQYYVKVVPTLYNYLSGTVLSTNQFSVTEHQTSVQSAQGRGLPGIFFFYDISPIMVKFEEHRRSFAHFLTQLCAVIGGVFTVTGIVDRLVYASFKNLEHKLDLGKAS